jgi:L-cysteate sulfo-lyase
MIACPLSLDSIPRLVLGHFPTPLMPMPRLQAELGVKHPIWIKHDDYSGPGFGGNKVRKLEYELAAARAAGATDVLTTGGLRSNHCRITAALAAQLGFACHLVLNGVEPARDSAEPASHWLDTMYGARVHYVARGQDRAPALAALADDLRRGGRQAYVIPLGASTPLGACGFVRAVLELKQQSEGPGFAPAAILHSTSSAGTQAGLAAGLRLAGWDQVKLIGISADDSTAAISAEVRRILSGLEPLLGLGQGDLAVPIHVDDGFTGPGYGIPSPEGTAAIELLARCEGVVLDPVYTSKAMAGLLALLPSLPPGPVVFWHTGGQLALFSSTGGD